MEIEWQGPAVSWEKRRPHDSQWVGKGYAATDSAKHIF